MRSSFGGRSGATGKITFVRERNKVYRIYTMASDGTTSSDCCRAG